MHSSSDTLGLWIEKGFGQVVEDAGYESFFLAEEGVMRHGNRGAAGDIDVVGYTAGNRGAAGDIDVVGYTDDAACFGRLLLLRALQSSACFGRLLQLRANPHRLPLGFHPPTGPHLLGCECKLSAKTAKGAHVRQPSFHSIWVASACHQAPCCS